MSDNGDEVSTLTVDTFLALSSSPPDLSLTKPHQLAT